MPLILFACFGCVPDKGALGIADTSADTDTDSLVPPCEGLISPWVLASSEDFVAAEHAAFPSFLAIAAARYNSEYWAEAGCPTTFISEEEHLLVEGDCTTSHGATYAGRLEWTRTAGLDTYQLDAFHFSEHNPSFTFEGDGSVLLVGDGTADTTEWTVDLWMSYVSGEFVYRLLVSDTDDAQEVDGYVWAATPDDARDGDFCVYDRRVWVASCPEEGDGVVAITGSKQAVGVYDGLTACDSCATARFGEGEPEAVCWCGRGRRPDPSSGQGGASPGSPAARGQAQCQE